MENDTEYKDLELKKLNERIKDLEQNEVSLNSQIQELEKLKKRIKDLEQNEVSLNSQIQELKNLLIDKDFETGIFIEKDIFNKLDRENINLRRIVDEFYTKELSKWYKDVKERVNKM